MSPNARSLQLLHDRGYLAEVTEKWIPRANVRRDLFGYGDILAVGHRRILLVQATTGSNVSARLKKIKASPALKTLQEAGVESWVFGWRKLKGKWVCREIAIV